MRSIAIFCACLALSFGIEIVVFSPARRASRKLLERIVEWAPALLNPPSSHHQKKPHHSFDWNAPCVREQVCPTGWWRRQNLRVQPGSMPSQRLRRQKIADPKLPFEGRGACRCPFEPGGNGGNAHIHDEEAGRSENGAKRLLPQTDKHVQNEPNRRITGGTPSSHLCIRFGKEQTPGIRRLATKDAMASGRSAIKAEAEHGPSRAV